MNSVYLTNYPFDHPTCANTDWDNPNQAHKTVMARFGRLQIPDGTARSHANILFRVEPDHGRTLIQSTLPPDDPTHTKDLTVLLDILTVGLRVDLLVDANTVRTVNRTHNGTVRTHRAQRHLDDIPAWLTNATAGALSDLTGLNVRRSYRNSRQNKLVVDTIRGQATIVEPARLTDLIVTGIGRAKAYGCGMISVLPVR